MDKKKNLIFNVVSLFVAGVLIFFDQFTKYLITRDLTGGKEIVIWKGVFKLVSHKNTGAVWGIMSNLTGLLVVISFVILGGIIFAFIKLPYSNRRLIPIKVITVLVFSGAVGNLIDRIRLKYVVDFLYFELINFPVFNVADCYITVSMFVLILLFIFYYRDEDFENIWPKKSR